MPLGDSSQHPGRGSGSHLNSAASPWFLAPPAPPDPWSPLGLVSVTPTGGKPWAWCGKRWRWPAISSPDLWPVLPCPWLRPLAVAVAWPPWLWPPPGFLSVGTGGVPGRGSWPQSCGLRPPNLVLPGSWDPGASGSSVEEVAGALCFAQLRK